MNIIEIATKHGAILEKLLAKSSGGLGEILVADALTVRGYSVRPTNNNARQSDLLVTSQSGVTFSVEVKTGRDKRPTWWVRTCPDPSASAIWCLVSAPGRPPLCLTRQTSRSSSLRQRRHARSGRQTSGIKHIPTTATSVVGRCRTMRSMPGTSFRHDQFGNSSAARPCVTPETIGPVWRPCDAPENTTR